MKYQLITYGCQMNKSDSERIAAFLENRGYKPASKENEANLIVVNMCSVRQSAVDRVFGLKPKFKELKAANSKLKTILTGCILRKDRGKFTEYFDYILDIKNLSNWQKIIKSQKSIEFPEPEIFVETIKTSYLKIQPNYYSYPIAYVPISNGCSNFCSYCVVPYTRGPQIFREVEEILFEVKNLINQNYKEIWLLGQNVNGYRSGSTQISSRITRISTQINAEVNFAKLLKKVNDIPGDFWLRFTSPHPKDFSNELIDIMAECEKITPYLNLPVQSGDNEILKKMNRPYTARDYKNLVKKIRNKIPEITLSTDVIVGFPGETKSHFENTVKLFKEIEFDMAYIAQYSPRPGTAAVKMEDNVPKEEKKKRERALTEILKKTALEKNKKYLQRTIEVLPLEWRNGFLIGKSFHYKTVKFKGGKDLIGKFQKVKITNATSFGLKGKITS